MMAIYSHRADSRNGVFTHPHEGFFLFLQILKGGLLLEQSVVLRSHNSQLTQCSNNS